MTYLPCVERIRQNLVEALLGQVHSKGTQTGDDFRPGKAVQLPTESLGYQFPVIVEAAVGTTALSFLIVPSRDL